MDQSPAATKGYFGLTDPDWYEFLLGCSRVDEVNFWQPHGQRMFRVLAPGDLFFFKLKGEKKAVAGFGFFERFERLPAWLAWDCFQTMNGAPDFDSMIDRLCRLRQERDPAARAGTFTIGCIMISAPVFFGEAEWVQPPSDWARTGIQQGKSYDLAVGEGRRVRDECFARATAAGRSWNVDLVPPDKTQTSPRYGSPVLVRPRLGQGLFSRAVRDAYGGACAVTHEHSEPVLEAAHIRPYSRGGEHSVNNGILLRRDLHRLYDLGYVTVSADHEFLIGERLRDEYKNGRSYYELRGSKITPPKRADWQPSRELLDWHRQQVFRN
jgi:putative restriction endonuclease